MKKSNKEKRREKEKKAKKPRCKLPPNKVEIPKTAYNRKKKHEPSSFFDRWNE